MKRRPACSRCWGHVIKQNLAPHLRGGLTLWRLPAGHHHLDALQVPQITTPAELPNGFSLLSSQVWFVATTSTGWLHTKPHSLVIFKSLNL